MSGGAGAAQQQQQVPILHLWPPNGTLPSLTAASLQVEAYLRLCKADFCVERCSSTGASPTGILPALELGADLAGAGAPTDLAAARAIIAALKKAGSGGGRGVAHGRSGAGLDLDAALSPAQRAEVAAFGLLVEAKLDPATLETTWVERRGFEEFRKAAYGASLPFPLNWFVPWSQRREMQRLLAGAGTAAAGAYEGAADALAALADRLRASGGRFFFGDAPSSLDSLVFGHVAFYLHSPIAAPVLRSKVHGQPVLVRFVESVLQTEFSWDAPPPPAFDDAGGWSSEAQGQGQQRRTPTVEERRMWRGSQYWLAGAAAAVGAYVLLSGHYVDLSVIETDDDVGGDGDDDDEEELRRHMDEREEEDGEDDGGGE